jgi:uncharacterized membrane protein
MKRLFWWPLIIIFSCIGIGLIAVANIDSPIRSLLTFWFLLVCPGMAFVKLLHISESATEWTLAIALSIGLNIIVSESILLAKIWSPIGCLAVLIAISLAGVMLQLANLRKVPIEA